MIFGTIWILGALSTWVGGYLFCRYLEEKNGNTYHDEMLPIVLFGGLFFPFALLFGSVVLFFYLAKLALDYSYENYIRK